MKSKILILFILIMFCVGSSAFAFTEPEFKNLIQGLYDKADVENNTLIKTITGVIINHQLEDDIYNYTGNGNGGFGAFDSIYITFANVTSVDYYVFNCYLFNTNENSKGYIGLLNPTGRTLVVTNLPNFKSSYALQNLSFRINKNNFTVLRNQNREYMLSQYNNFSIFSNGNNGTNYNMSARVSAMITKQFKIYTDDNMNILSSEDYFLKGFYPEEPPKWTFTKYNNLKLNYSVNEMPLGTFSGDVNPSELNYIWVDYTTQQTIYNSFDYTGMYPSIYNRGMSLFIYNRLLQDHEYDLYIYKENEDTQQFHYTYIYTSGDTGGWTGQDTTNNIIDNNNQQYEDNTKQPNLNDYNVSGDSIISSLGVTFSGDPYDNVWFMLINGFSETLTSDNAIRQWTLTLPGNQTYVIDLDILHNSIPDAVRVILTLVSSAFLTLKMIKWVKIITDLVSSGNIDEVLEMNEEERHY